MKKAHRAAYVEINLDNYIHNINEISNKVKGELCPVVKANAYGSGAIEITKQLKELKINIVAVANILEALEIRKEIEDIDILILGYTEKEDFQLVVDNNLIQTVYDNNDLAYYDSIDGKMRAHLKVNTGMNRLGIRPLKDNIEYVKKLYNHESINLEGAFTHFYAADDGYTEDTITQEKKFREFLDMLDKQGIHLKNNHVSNSTGILYFDFDYKYYRPGIIQYGIYPDITVSQEILNLKPVFSLCAKITSITEIEKGEYVGYSKKFIAKRKTVVATLPIGYADGVLRHLSNKGQVLLKGKRINMIGNICMDQMMIDVTDIADEIKVEDNVIIIGSDDNNTITPYELAEITNTNTHVILSGLRNRLPKIYIKNNEIYNVRNMIK